MLPWGPSVTLLRTTPTILLGMTSDSLIEKLLAQMLFRTGRGAGAAEQTSWGSSLPVLAADLVAAGLGQVVLKDMRVESRGAVLTVPSLEADLPLVSAGLSKRVLVTRLVAKGCW